MAGLPDDTTSVIVRAPGVRRSFPVPVADKAQTPKVAVPDGLDDEEIYDLAQPDRPPRPRHGAQRPARPARGRRRRPGAARRQRDQDAHLAGPARLVGRGAGGGAGPGDFSTLMVDVTNDDSDGYWPEGIGASESSDDLGGVTIVDPAGQRLYGSYQSDGYGFGANDTFLSIGDSGRYYAAFPRSTTPPRRSRSTCPPSAPSRTSPWSTCPPPRRTACPPACVPRTSTAARMDVLDIARMPRRQRDPRAHPAGQRVQPRRRHHALRRRGQRGHLRHEAGRHRHRPTATTRCRRAGPPGGPPTWRRASELPFEARFPELPDDVDQVVLVAAGNWFPSGPVTVGSKRQALVPGRAHGGRVAHRRRPTPPARARPTAPRPRPGKATPSRSRSTPTCSSGSTRRR